MNKKILIIRFNSIGDIVLTSPVIKALHDEGYEVHYLVKKAFSSLLTENPLLSKVWEFDNNLNQLSEQLNELGFYAVVDLHNTLRSFKLIQKLKCKRVYKFKKPRLKYWLLTKLNFDVKPEPHIVKRFLKVVEPLVGVIDRPQTSFYFSTDLSDNIKSLLPENYICIAIGAAFYTKTIPVDKLVQIINRTDDSIVLIGGVEDKERAAQIIEKSSRDVVNLVGQISISDSAHVMKKSKLLLSGDTGMMHIGAALGIQMINVFGSTHPILGYTPFYGNLPHHSHIVQNENLKCRPCTKQGRHTCPKGHFKCMRDINVDEIIKII